MKAEIIKYENEVKYQKEFEKEIKQNIEYILELLKTNYRFAVITKDRTYSYSNYSVINTCIGKRGETKEILVNCDSDEKLVIYDYVIPKLGTERYDVEKIEFYASYKMVIK